MKRALLVAMALLAVGGAAAGVAWKMRDAEVTAFAATPFGSSEPRRVEIATGTGPKAVATQLEQTGAVSSAGLLYRYLRREGLGPKLRAGEYELTGPLTPAQVVEKLVRGEVKQYHFTVAEGLRVEEILPLIAGSELRLSAAKLAELAGAPSFVRSLGVPADSLEGFLFPDTYSFPRSATEEAVLKKMVARTLDEVAKAPRKPGVALGLLETVTLASIVEKETAAPAERPHIACVFHNRLQKRMRLETDPTVIYARLLLTGQYTKNITKADLRAEHPYNTYRVKGLPPGPIAAPGTAAIRAALTPLDCGDLFFVSRNDGTHVFCPDLACHEAAVKKWQIDFFRAKRQRR